MARHVNSQYMLFKQNLQNKFAERYRRDTTPQYSQQDVEHLKLIHPEIPAPVIPAARHFRSFSSRRRPIQQVNLDEFEQEYQNFINMLKANKKAQEEAVQEQVEPVVEETAPVVEETAAEEVVETPVVETKPTKKKKAKQVEEVQTEAPIEEEKSELPEFDLT